jgi:hypothetical protein
MIDLFLRYGLISEAQTSYISYLSTLHPMFSYGISIRGGFAHLLGVGKDRQEAHISSSRFVSRQYG